MTSHDQLFKDLLRTFFQDFVRLVAPEPAARLDLSAPAFLDKEAFTDWPEGDRRALDLLAEVPILGSQTDRALVHVEVEREARAEMGLRLGATRGSSGSATGSRSSRR